MEASSGHPVRPALGDVRSSIALWRPWHEPGDPRLRRSGVILMLVAGAIGCLVLAWLARHASPSWLLVAFATALVTTERTELPMSVQGGEHKVVLNDVLMIIPFIYFAHADVALLMLALTLGATFTLPISWSMRLAHVTSMLVVRSIVWWTTWEAIQLGAGPFTAAFVALATVIVYSLTLFYPLGQLLLETTPYGFRAFTALVVRVRTLVLGIELPFAIVAVAAYEAQPWSVPLLAIPLIVVWRASLLAPQIEGLLEADRMKSRFVSMASHELQTPLTTIIGFADTLDHRWETFDEDTRRQFLRVIREQGERLARLVRDLLVLSRVESGVPKSEPADSCLDEIVADALRTIAHQSADVLVLVPGGMRVHADAHQTVQMLVNLLTNAVKYGVPPIEVHARRLGAAWVEVRVIDHGPGVAEELRPRLFDQFSRGGDVSSSIEGSGLGLSIVRSLAFAQRGDVAYEDRDGGGACFVLRLRAVPRYAAVNTPDEWSSDVSRTETRAPSSTS